MSILTVENLSHSYAGRVIFEDVSFRLLKGEHVGLVGANGEGKSTFMNILTSHLEPESGKVIWSKNVKVGYLDQHTKLEEGMSILDTLKLAFKDLFEIETSIQKDYETMMDVSEEKMDHLLEDIGIRQEYLDQHDFYLIDSKIEEVSNALGISEYSVLDSWACIYSRDYSISLWYGYDEVTSTNYMLNIDATLGRRRIIKKLVKQIISGNQKLLTSS